MHLPDLLTKPSMMNLLFSTIVLIAGLCLYWVWRPQVLDQHPFVGRAFEFWLIKWVAYAVTWGLVTTSDLRMVLVTDDFNTILGFGLVAAMWAGDSYRERQTIINLSLVSGLLFSWNFIARSQTHNLMVWLFPSMTLTTVMLLGMGFVFVRRYGAYAISLAVVVVLYVLLQLPTYVIIFGGGNVDSEMLKWLAFAKLLFATTFYTILFLPVIHVQQLAFPSFPGLGEKLGKVVTWGGAAVGSGIMTRAGYELARYLWFVFTGHKVS